MTDLIAFITAIGPALTAGLFGLVMWQLQKADADRKANRSKSDEQFARIEANTRRSQLNEEAIAELGLITARLKDSAESNDEGLKLIMRYLLQRYHAEYMLQGFLTSRQKTEFLEAYEIYHAKGGNGTAEGWKNELCELPVRDDLPVTNPYLEMLKRKKEK